MHIYTFQQTTRDNMPPQCVGESMFFWDHTGLESQKSGTTSKCNKRECGKIVEVAKFLVDNDIPPEDITVLAAYRGQVRKHAWPKIVYGMENDMRFLLSQMKKKCHGSADLI